MRHEGDFVYVRESRGRSRGMETARAVATSSPAINKLRHRHPLRQNAIKEYTHPTPYLLIIYIRDPASSSHTLANVTEIPLHPHILHPARASTPTADTSHSSHGSKSRSPHPPSDRSKCNKTPQSSRHLYSSLYGQARGSTPSSA